ncbi:MAG: nucleotide exchange factor GrpE [Wujia sp.]
MKMANTSNNQTEAIKAEETVEEIKAVDDAPVDEGTDVKIDEVEQVEEDDKEACEAAKPKPVPKGSRRGSKALMLELERTKELAQGNEEKYKRLLAEFENARQRNEKESKKMYDIGAKEVLEKLLSVVDNLERALASIPEEDKERPFEQGVDKIYRQMMVTLEGIGVKPMNAEGTQFDPDLHNAVIHVEDENYGENIVAEEMQKGYMYKDQVLRHSMVKVAN